jgi:magnesium-transporting ATPase (P-type)
LPTGESEDGCIVLENVEPMIKKIGSYLICTVAPEQKEDLVKSIKRAYY